MVSKFFCNKKLVSINKYKYDAKGNEICNIFIQKGSHSFYSESRRYYNEANQCIKLESFTNPKVIECIYFFTYDNQGSCTAIICRKPEGGLNHKFLYIYDYQQREIHERCIKGNGHVAWYATHFYNSKFKLLEKLYYKKDLLFYKTKCTFDLEGNKTLTRKYLHDSHLIKWNGFSKIDFYLYI